VIAALEVGGCVFQHLNREMEQRVETKVDHWLAGDELTPDQRLIRQAAVAIDRRDYFEAETLLDAALQINPTSTAAKLNLAAVYEATNRTERAAQLYAELVRPVGYAPVAVTGDAGFDDADAARVAAMRLEALRNPKPPSSNQLSPSLAKPRAERSDPRKMTAQPAESSAIKRTGGMVKETKSLHVTLSVYPSEAAAREGWAKLVASHGDVLKAQSPVVLPVDAEPGKGLAYRLATGPFGSAAEAAKFCEQLNARRVYCVISG
jgi:tetratricopeptide (TPR) repeat protein